ncbi:hypothetical protein APHACPA_0685 [Rickettsia amblyommatis str. Ac/Pa]|uniref:Uncharacterized protein n=1 Tax=Rickettsia amblyommatis str. Ac/Pa TaxID=1359164 RepID=A0A0F3N454_RICAM|nr:hypothetical protein APHACPA_0685 [Rickettsia amblyommatis str. Ac/Pa]
MGRSKNRHRTIIIAFRFKAYTLNPGHSYYHPDHEVEDYTIYTADNTA